MKKIVLITLGLLFINTMLYAQGSFVLEPGVNIETGQTKIATAGTAVPLSTTERRVLSVNLEPLLTNSGRWVHVGASTITVNNSSTDGRLIASGSSLTLDVNDLNDVYINSQYINDGVSWIAIIR